MSSTFQCKLNGIFWPRLGSAVAMLMVMLVAGSGHAQTSAGQTSAESKPMRLAKIELVGLTTYAASIVLPETGLRVGQMVTQSDLNACVSRLIGSGYFRSANYNYTRSPNGLLLQFSVVETPRTMPVRLEIPGYASTDLWAKMKQLHPLAEPMMPDSHDAMETMQRWLENTLRTLQTTPLPVQQSLSNDPAGAPTLTFRPVKLATVTEFQLFGLQRSSFLRAQNTLERLLINQEYIEPVVRKSVEATVVASLREQGFLQGRLERMELQPVAEGTRLALHFHEGLAYQLRNVDLLSATLEADETQAVLFPIGQLADGLRIDKAIASIRAAIRRKGYLLAEVRTVPRFDEANQTVELKVEAKRGERFQFAGVTFAGLTAEEEAEAKRVWALPVGANYDNSYPESFLQQLRKTQPAETHAGFRAPAIEQNIVPKTNKVRVRISFR